MRVAVIVEADRDDVLRVVREHLPDATIEHGLRLHVIRSPSLDPLSDAELWQIASANSLPVRKIRREP